MKLHVAGHKNKTGDRENGELLKVRGTCLCLSGAVQSLADIVHIPWADDRKKQHIWNVWMGEDSNHFILRTTHVLPATLLLAQERGLRSGCGVMAVPCLRRFELWNLKLISIIERLFSQVRYRYLT